MLTLFILPVPSTAFMQSAVFSMLAGRKCSINYSYESEDSILTEKLVFDGVESFKCTYYKACSIKMIKAYDKIIDVDNSLWLDEIKHNLSESKADFEELRHLRIYFDDGPCYEFICRSFTVIN